MMDRLTKRYGNGKTTIDASLFGVDQTVLDIEIKNCKPIMAAVERLAEFEDAEAKAKLRTLNIWTMRMYLL